MSDNYYNQQNVNNYGYSNAPVKKRVNGFEILIIAVSFILIIAVFVIGFLGQGTRNRDAQRVADINNVIRALDNFYANSSVDPSSRAYPKTNCSFDLNEVDFELTLRDHLIGRRIELDSHEYISPENFPRDNWGVYSKTLNQRKIPYRCEQNINTTNGFIYNDEYPSCNFTSGGENKFKKCYIYTSSNNGDTYQIGYFSEIQNNFVVYKKFRENPLELVR